jgi:glycosyltransferase involved in cell wall biosynthesis
VLRAHPAVQWVSEPDRGQSDALNKALAMASGDIIGWLNADDIYLPGTLERVLTWASESSAEVAYGDCLFVDGGCRLVRGKEEHRFNRDVLLWYGCYLPSTSTFFRRSLLDRGLLRLDESYRYTMDFELFLRLAFNGVEFDYLASDLAAFRFHGDNLSMDAVPRTEERYRAQRAYGRPDASDLELRWRGRFSRVHHWVLKGADGGFVRQMEWARRRGEVMRWW